DDPQRARAREPGTLAQADGGPRSGAPAPDRPGARSGVSFTFALEATARAARAGTLPLPHGTVPTPAFMPVGTHGVVRGLSAADVRRTGARIILGNTYHLH